MKAANSRTGSHSRRRNTIRTPVDAVRIVVPPVWRLHQAEAPSAGLRSCPLYYRSFLLIAPLKNPRPAACFFLCALRIGSATIVTCLGTRCRGGDPYEGGIERGLRDHRNAGPEVD